MKTAQQGAKAGSTQKFTGIVDIVDEAVILPGSAACLIIEVQASNFALLSQEEQQSKIYAYASFLNSLSFPLQIVIRNKKIDISSYINLLNQQIKNPSGLHPNLSEQQNQSLITYITMYRDFIQELVKINTVLDKKFYIVITYSSLEKGMSGAASSVKGVSSTFAASATAGLKAKADSVLSQLSRLSLRAKVLEKEELVKLFYEIYNPNNPVSRSITEGTQATVITTQQKV